MLHLFSPRLFHAVTKQVEKIREDRRHAEEEMATHLRQVQGDIEEARQRISEERLRVDQEGSQRRRGVAHEYEKFRALAKKRGYGWKEERGSGLG